MRFGILGPLEVRSGSRLVDPGGPRHKALLAMLLTRANEVVSADFLIEQLWPGQEPSRARAGLQVYVSELRRALQPRRPARSRDGVLVTHPPGYRLVVKPGALDAHEFERLVGEARGADDPRRAAALFREALGLWRGRALADIGVEELERTVATRLEQARLAALVERVDVELRLGQHTSLVGELAELVAEHPFAERLHEQLMVALYRCGRQGDALGVYRDLRTSLAEELGVEPGSGPQRVQHAILTGAPADRLPPPVVAAPPAPAQLPPDVAAFTGREAELGKLGDLIAPADSGAVVALTGPAGVGKSALAVYAAHRLRDRFPDGQLYVNLQGATIGSNPLRPVEALGRWLRALGVDARAVPADPDEAAARFRSILDGRRLLLVCDNAADAAQVRPLLPASPSCAVIVTSRRILATLDSATHLRLDVLSEPHAITLLGRLVGRDRVSAQAQAAAEVVRLCGNLPLGLRIAAARLVAHPEQSVRDLADRLGDARRRLDELQVDDLAVRSSFAVSYLELEPEPARMFRLLGLHAGHDIGVPAAAALADRLPDRAARMLDQLTEMHLLECTAPGRYGFHDLLRVYAAERAAADDDRRAALVRMLNWYLHTADAADRLLNPLRRRLDLDTEPPAHPLPLEGYDEALSWCETERENLVAATRLAAEQGLHAVAWQIPAALYNFFRLRKHWTDQQLSHEIGLQSASYVGDLRGQAWLHNRLGMAHQERERYDDALHHLERALAIYRDIEDLSGQGDALNNLGILSFWGLHRHDAAIDYLRHAVATFRQTGDRRGQGVALNNLGDAYRESGDFDAAVDHLRQAVAICRQIGDRHGEGNTLDTLGNTYLDLGQVGPAIDHLNRALTIFRETGHQYGEALALKSLGHAHHQSGSEPDARTCWQAAHTIFESLDDPQAAQLLNHLTTPDPTNR